MSRELAGIIGAPVTPFNDENSVDYDTFAKQVNFLVENGVAALAHPMHIGESLNLTDQERRELARVLVEAAGGRVPTYVHTSFAGTDLSVDAAACLMDVTLDPQSLRLTASSAQRVSCPRAVDAENSH
jgi:dihydrodipicolinate synthase/N-acetylneuraminate lyase